jgi:hypothetical protein
MGEWLLSRRDRLIVARHEVPGSDAEDPRPGGTVEVIVSPTRERAKGIAQAGLFSRISHTEHVL